jgi:phosphoenolpyruvate carboxykinase (ATP)
MLTCDAFGVLPPVSKLNTAQAMYHFISGYTAKVAGTEEGVREPSATFSACFGQPFLIWHPTKYAQMLADRIHHHKVNVWLVNTGWIGGKYGVGQRIPLRYSRAIIDAIHSGELAERVEYETADVFNLAVPKTCTGVPNDILHPERCWQDKAGYQKQLCQLASLFQENFKIYQEKATQEMLDGAPNSSC